MSKELLALSVLSRFAWDSTVSDADEEAVHDAVLTLRGFLSQTSGFSGPGGCPTDGCLGDDRYAGPGRGHLSECQYPFPPKTKPDADSVEWGSRGDARCGACRDLGNEHTYNEACRFDFSTESQS